MAEAAKRASALTVLTIGSVRVPVGLYPAHADPKKKLIEFDTAGPNGGRLVKRASATATPVAELDEAPEAVRSDPLGDADELHAPPRLRAVTDTETIADGPAVASPSPSVVAAEYVEKLVEESTGEVVERDQVRRGVRLEDGSFIDCTAQLAQIDQDTKLDQMAIVGFVDVAAIPRARVKTAYYLGASDEDAPKAMRLLFEAMKATRRGAIVKLTKRSRQSLGMITFARGCLMLFELVWTEDFREPPAQARALAQAIVTDAEVEMATQLVHAMSTPPTIIESLRDDAIEKRETLYAKALAGEVEPVELVAPAPEEDALFAQLEASLAAIGSS